MGGKRIENRCPIRKRAIVIGSATCQKCRHNKQGICEDKEAKLYADGEYRTVTDLEIDTRSVQRYGDTKEADACTDGAKWMREKMK